MKWDKLPDGRSCLPVGAILQLEEAGGSYCITGPPIGYGGSGIIYPAVRVRRGESGWEEEEMNLAVKECCPSVPGTVLPRDDAGRILGGDNKVYRFALEQMRREKTITGIIYNAGFRLVPVWTSCEREQIAPDGVSFAEAENYYAVMERVDEKGSSLEDLACREKLTAKDIMSLGCQLLRALKEVHGSGFIHGDIQTNNIFVKGYEAGDDLGVVSLLDFGAARKLEADQRTAPIEDRALYTTKGYTPPECLAHNDGTLRLTPAADLYSAGCIFLRMLSGRPVSRQAVSLVTNGRYLYSRQAAKLQCPDSAVEAINRFLDRALQEDPADRYQSAEEMLREALRIEQSLAPANIAIASSQYAAFISYCHTEKTGAAAQLLADALEHYPIPGYASNAGGKKRRRIGRVFLDRMELSGGGDMGEQLAKALEQSAYLIVILGGGSEHSIWVAREIEVFLKSHTRDRILTVLVEGNEKDSMPEILKTQEFFTGEGKKVHAVESLSADLRAESVQSMKRLLRTEKLRLIAPMLGCSFDDLRRREKEARSRRLIRGLSAGMAAFAVIASVIGYQAYQIRSRNIRLQIVHAGELAEESGRCLKRGDREEALRLALEALPASSKDRSVPLCAETRAALQNALYLYRDTDSLIMAQKALRTMKMGRKAAAGSEKLSPDGRRMLTQGADGSVFVWDLPSGKCIAGPDESEENELNGKVRFAAFSDNEHLLLIKTDKAMRLTIPVPDAEGSGTAEPPGCDVIATEKDLTWLALWPEDTPLMGTFNDDRSRIAFCSLSGAGLTEDGVRQVVPELTVCDADTLKELGSLASYSDPALSGFGSANSLTASGPVFSEDGRWAALPLADFFKSDKPDSDSPAGALLLLDLTGDESRIVTDRDSGFLCCCFAEGNSLIACGYTPALMWELQEMPLKGAVSRIDALNGTVVWKTPLAGQTEMGTDTMGILLAEDRAVFWANRQLQILDAADGRLLDTMQVRNGIAGVSAGEGDSADYVLAGDRRGNLFAADIRGGVISEIGTSIDCPVDHFWYTQSVARGGMIVSDTDDGRYVLLGASDQKPPMTVLAEGMIGTYFTSARSEYMLVEREKGSGFLTALDLQSGEWKGDWPADGVRGFAGAKQIFLLKEEDGKQMLQILALDTGEILQERGLDTDTELFFSGFLCSWQDGSQLHLLDLNGETTVELAEKRTGADMSSPEETVTMTGMTVRGNERYLYLFCRQGEDLTGTERLYGVYDLGKQSWLPLPSWAQSGEDSGSLAVSDDGKAAAWIDREASTIRIFFPGYDEARAEILVPPGNCQAAFGRDNQMLYYIGDDGILRAFDTKTGEQTAQSSETYSHVRRLSVDHKKNVILLDAVAADDSHVPGIRSEDMRVLWLYEETPEGELCRMAGADNGIFNEAADRMICMDAAGGRILLYNGEEKLDDLILRAEELLDR